MELREVDKDKSIRNQLNILFDICNGDCPTDLDCNKCDQFKFLDLVFDTEKGKYEIVRKVEKGVTL